MPYLSQILGSRIEDSADAFVGKLADIVVKPSEAGYAPVLFLAVHPKKSRTTRYVPYSFVESMSRGQIDLKTLSAKIPLVEEASDWVYLSRDVLDQQIVDVEGARVVRVNDLRIGQFEKQTCVLGIDISFKGLLRRLGLASLDIFDWFKVNLIDWRKTQLVKGAVKLSTVSTDLARLHPADLANIIEDLSIKQGSSLVESLDDATAAKVIEEIDDPLILKALVQRLSREEAVRIISQMSVDEVVDLLKILPKDEARVFISQLKNVKLKKIENLIEYEDDTAGGLMTTEYVSVLSRETVEKALAEVRRLSPLLRSILYVYVVDKDGAFKGAVSLRRLLVADKEQPLVELVKDFSTQVTLQLTDKIDQVINVMTKYDLYFAAVLDKRGKLIGVVSIDDVMRQIAPKA
jgi:CBS domain-containing protein